MSTLINPLEISSAEKATLVLDMHSIIKSGNIPETAKTQGLSDNVKALGELGNWLPIAAEEYRISPKLEDYVISAVPAIPSDVPNKNGVGFPLEELTKWNVAQGRVSFESWIGKPTYLEHKNNDPTQAKGVIFDSMLRKVGHARYDKLWKVVMLAGLDRSRDTALAASHMNGSRSSWSMGALVNNYECSICGAMGNPSQNVRKPNCGHLPMRAGFNVITVPGFDRPKLAYSMARGITGYELSSVGSPAWHTAVNPTIRTV